MTSYGNIYEVLNGGANSQWIGDELDGLTVDQRIAAANVIALAAIAEEISALNPQNTQRRDGDGVMRDGWGTKI